MWSLFLLFICVFPSFVWAQIGPGSPVQEITQTRFEAITAGGPCTAGARYFLKDWDDPARSQWLCPRSGVGPLILPYSLEGASQPAVDTRPHLPLFTDLSQSSVLGLHALVGVYGNTSQTLPPIATAPAGVYVLQLQDATGPFTLIPDGTDLINFRNTPQTMSGQGSIMLVWRFGTVSWGVLAPISVEALLDANFVTLGTQQTITGAKSFDDLTVTGNANFSGADDFILPLQSGPTQTVDGDCRWDTAKHKQTCGHNAQATVTVPQVLCRVTGVTSVNDSGSGSGSDFNHTGAACSIPTTTLFAGDVLNVRIYGRLVTGATGTTILAGLKQSTTTDIIRTTGASTGNNVAGNYWFLDFLLVVSADPGASVSVTGYAGNILVGMRDTFNSSQTGPVNLATNGALSLTPFTRWSAAGGSDNEIDVRGMIVTRQ